MRRNVIYLVLLNIVTVFLVSGIYGCSESDEPVQWFVELDNRCQETFCHELLTATLNTLHGQIYFLTQRGEVVTLESKLEAGDRRDTHFPPHQFLVLDEDIHPDVGTGKVYMRFNPQNKDGLYNADFLLFLFRKNNSWERVLNPGNFRFKSELTQSELRERIKRLIVSLTYK